MLDRGGQIGRVGVQHAQRLVLLRREQLRRDAVGEREEVVQVAVSQGRQLVRLREPVLRVLTDGLQQPEDARLVGDNK